MPSQVEKKRKRPRQVSGQMVPRSVRISDEVWEKARTRSRYDGVTISYVMYTLLEGYGKGLLNLPKVTMTYSAPVETVDQ